MSAILNRLGPSEIAQSGKEIYNRIVLPQLGPDDDGKFVVVDVLSEDYELDEDDYAASKRLRSRRPQGEFLLMMAGYPTAYRFAGPR